jgi:ABC-type dipeptide/oligopeptide/nickel transport system permease component
MGRYIMKRVILLIPLLAGITFVAFLLLQAIPGDPVLNLVGERSSPEIVEQLRREIGSDRGFLLQYAGYLRLLAKGDFGRSYHTNRDVLSDIATKFPNTLRLALTAMLIAVPLGMLAGCAAAYHKKGLIAAMVELFSVAGVSVPVFWSGLLIMLLVSLELRLLPPSGTGGLRFVILPAVVLSIPAMATLARVTRTAVSEVLGMPHVNTARAKGLSPVRITLVHVIKNAIVPVVTIIGLDFGSYLNGAEVTETIFGWDGLGRFTMEGIIKRDYPVILGCIIAGTALFVLVNLVTDVLYHYLDPRVRLHGDER